MRAYQGRRFKYANFYDIVNAFYISSKLPGTEKYLMDIFKLMLTRLENLRRFFFFVDSIIKNMPDIRRVFGCFRVVIVGKLAGGTKRTKSLTIGFGRYPIQTLAANVSNNYMNFSHRYGEFGIQFVMWRISTYRPEIPAVAEPQKLSLL